MKRGYVHSLFYVVLKKYIAQKFALQISRTNKDADFKMF